MTHQYLFIAALLGAGLAVQMPAASVCPSTAQTTSDCDFLITIGGTGTVSVSMVPNSSPFNAPVTLGDGTMEPGGDASLIGVVNDYSKALKSLTLQGAGATNGIFDFQFNGICVYTNAAYCATAASGYEGPTTTFSDLKIGGNFETTVGTVNFAPSLSGGQNTYFSLMDSATDINANGGLKVLGETFGGTSVTPEPADVGLAGLGLSLLMFWRSKRKSSV